MTGGWEGGTCDRKEGGRNISDTRGEDNIGDNV